MGKPYETCLLVSELLNLCVRVWGSFRNDWYLSGIQVKRWRQPHSHTVAQSTDSTLRPVHHCQCFRMVGWYVLTCWQHCKLFVKWWLC